MAEQLLPCPFCGKSNAVVMPPTCTKQTPYDPTDRAFPVVRCCCVDVHGDDWDDTGVTAAHAWNRRATPQPPAATGEGVLAILDAEIARAGGDSFPAGRDLIQARAAVEAMGRALLFAERHCPCGARPESPNTHPHVPGCQIDAALRALNGGKP